MYNQGKFCCSRMAAFTEAMQGSCRGRDLLLYHGHGAEMVSIAEKSQSAFRKTRVRFSAAPPSWRGTIGSASVL